MGIEIGQSLTGIIIAVLRNIRNVLRGCILVSQYNIVNILVVTRTGGRGIMRGFFCVFSPAALQALRDRW